MPRRRIRFCMPVVLFVQVANKVLIRCMIKKIGKDKFSFERICRAAPLTFFGLLTLQIVMCINRLSLLLEIENDTP